MKQLNLPRRKVAYGQICVSFVLVLLSVIFAFMPIITVDLSNGAMHEVVNEGLAGLQEDVPEIEQIQIPDKVDVTTAKLMKALSILTKMVKVTAGEVKSMGSTVSAEEREKLQKAQEDLAKEVTSKKGQEAIVMTVALFGQVLDFSKDEQSAVTGALDAVTGEGAADEQSAEKTEDSGKSFILIRILRIAFLLVLFIYALIWPFALLLLFVINTIKVLLNLKTPENVAGKISGLLTVSVTLAITMALLFTLMPGFGWGSGFTVVFTLGIINMVINAVATRLRSYQPLHFRYANIAQGCALLSLVGFFVFFGCVLKTNVLQNFLGSVEKYIAALDINVRKINAALRIANKPAFDPSKGYVVDCILIYIYGLLALAVCSTTIASIIERICFTKRKRRDQTLVGGVSGIIAAIIPFIISALKNGKVYKLNDNGVVSVDKAEAIYSMSSASRGALIGMLIGGIIIVASCVLKKVLIQKFCGTITEIEEELIISGKAPEVEAVAVEAAPAAVAEEAQTEAAPAVVAEQAQPEAAPVVAEAVATETVAEAAPETVATETAAEPAPEAAAEAPAEGSAEGQAE